jgi:hypothetical protein
METFLFKALVEDGGAWGLLAALSLFWAMYNERKAKSRQDDIIEKIQKQSSKIRELELDRASRIEEISKVNEERVDDLKQLLEDYHKTMSDTANALDKIRFIIENSKA